MSDAGDWKEYRELVLHEMDRLDKRITADFRAHMANDERLAIELNETLRSLRLELSSLRESQTSIREDIAGLKVRAGLIGGVAGAVSSFVSHLLGKT